MDFFLINLNLVIQKYISLINNFFMVPEKVFGHSIHTFKWHCIRDEIIKSSVI